jgi:hypothetical protein
MLGASVGVTCFYIATALGLAVTVGPFLIGGLLGIGLLVLFCWGGVRLFSLIFLNDDPEYREFIEEGGDPYLDFVPPPFNTNSVEQGLGEVDLDNYADCDRVECQGCGNIVIEPEPGEFRNGVWCPFCGSMMQTP